MQDCEGAIESGIDGGHEQAWGTFRSGKQEFKAEQVPLSKFISHLQTIDYWLPYVKDEHLSFAKLLRTENLFTKVKDNNEVMLNMNTLKLYALLMCTGSQDDKG
jgi:hypothetical protein